MSPAVGPAPLRLVTWNVLHRVHAVNWREPPAFAFPDEAERQRRIAAEVAGFFAAGAEVVCLQEVSGDQLEAVRAAAGEGVSVFSHGARRVPRLHGGGPPGLRDPSECVAVLVAAPGAQQVEGHTFDGDHGKGFVAVRLARGVLVVCTHVTHGDKGAEQMQLLAARARAAPGAAVITGDFNAEIDALRAGLGEGFSFTDLTGQPCTRTATDQKHAHTIDHVAAWRGSVRSGRVLEAHGLSDHLPVEAWVDPLTVAAQP